MVRLEEGPAPGKEGLYGPKWPELNDRLNKRLDHLNTRKFDLYSILCSLTAISCASMSV
jgi:hypothetical protein